MGGYNLIAYNTDVFPILSSEPNYYIVQNGAGRGSFFGLSSEIPITTNMQNFIVAEVAYDSKPGDFVAFASRRAGSDTGYSLSASLSYVLINLGYKFNFWNGNVPQGLGIQLSTSLGFIVNKNFERKIAIYPSNDSNVPQTIVSQSVPIQSINAFRFAIRTEFTYDIPVFSNWLFTPSIGYDAPLTKIDPSLNWRANSVYFGMALQFSI